jgi:hypothetical protein
VTGIRRDGRVLSGRVAVRVGKLTKPCPKCGAAVGWRCGWFVGPAWTPIKRIHQERRDAS